jgi:hypothetical protein
MRKMANSRRQHKGDAQGFAEMASACATLGGFGHSSAAEVDHGKEVRATDFPPLRLNFSASSIGPARLRPLPGTEHRTVA